MSDDILDSSLGTEQPGISAVHPAASHESQTRSWAGEALGRRWRFSCPRVMMLCLVLLGEVFRELHTSTATERSILPSLSCHTQSSPAQFFVEPNWDLEQGTEQS